MKCSVPKCGEPPVIQWTKLLDDEQASAHIEGARRSLLSHAEGKKLNLRIQLAALQDAFVSPPKHLSPEDVVAFQGRAALQIERTREEHDQVQTEFNLEHHREGSTRSLAHCEHHRYEDLEWYARQHQVECSGARDCGCS